MPCWTVAESKVNLANADQGLLQKALQKLGFSNFHTNDNYAGRFNARFTADRFSDQTSVKLMNDGTISVTAAGSQTSLDALAAEVKRAYSGAIITESASRFGWLLKPQGENKWQVLKR